MIKTRDKTWLLLPAFLCALFLILGIAPARANVSPVKPGAPTSVFTDAAEKERLEYERLFKTTNQHVDFSSHTSVKDCLIGTPNLQAHTQALTAWNYLRSLNSMAPVSLLSDSYTPQTVAQQTALALLSGPNASAHPSAKTGFPCANALAQLGARSGLIARDSALNTPAHEILRYFTESSTTDANDSLGHRLQMLNPTLARTGLALLSLGSSGPSASSIQTSTSQYASLNLKADPSLEDKTFNSPPYFAWPASGYFPGSLLPTGFEEKISRWSFSVKCADLSNAAVSVRGPNGNIGLQIVRRGQYGVSEEKTPWQYGGYDTVLFKIKAGDLSVPLFYATSDYEVKVSNIKSASPRCSPPSEVTYHVRVFNPRWPSDPNGDADRDSIPNALDFNPTSPAVLISRLGGETRVQTAAKIANQAFSLGAQKVYIARDDIAADALAGGSLSDGPILLAPRSGTIPPALKKAIERINPATLVALGGENALSQTLMNSLAAGARTVERLDGTDRTHTSILIARRAFSRAESLYIADGYGPNGLGSPDPVAGGSLSDGPIILINPKHLQPTLIAQLAKDLKVKRIVALGGAKVLPDQLLYALGTDLPLSRLAGEDRYSTSRAIAFEAYRQNPQTNAAYLARGDIFTDAIAGGSLSDGPIILVKNCSPLPERTINLLAHLRAYRITALGGTSAICQSLLEQAKVEASEHFGD